MDMVQEFKASYKIKDESKLANAILQKFGFDTKDFDYQNRLFEELDFSLSAEGIKEDVVGICILHDDSGAHSLLNPSQINRQMLHEILDTYDSPSGVPEIHLYTNCGVDLHSNKSTWPIRFKKVKIFKVPSCL